jgi:protein-tyrosine-phosphatase
MGFRISSLLPHTRRALVAWLLAAPALAQARPTACRPAAVLFVCPAGTVKSAIAREMLKRRAAAAGVTVEVRSRGVTPEDHVSPALAARLRADGLDPAAEAVGRLAAGDAAQADIVVAFDEAADAPELRGARAWRTPSWNADYDAAKADLEARLDALVAELRGRNSHCASSR